MYKEYNPCGDLTGKESEFCDEATQGYFNLPYVEVMRTITVKAVADFEHETNFRNVDKFEHWADYSLNDIEQRANLNFDSFTRLQAGLCKYIVHLLYENRYNVHYNCLENYCHTLATSTSEELERKINSLAQEANYFSTVNELQDELLNFISA